MNPVLNVQTNGSTQGIETSTIHNQTQTAGAALQFPGLDSSLQSVEELLRTELQSDIPYVDELLQYVGSLSGKRMRPSLLFLTAEATGGVRQSHIVLATVIEMIHIATLVHDDVLDGASKRRHKVTVNQKYGNQSSVLLGDYLFTHSFYLASTLDTTFACRRIGQATNRVCAGELSQVGNAGNLSLTEDEYYDIIRGKTAELCACATALGAHYAGASDAVTQAMESYGMHLGVAFQIADDLLDLTGDETKTGKSQGTDIEKQKMTLPLIHLLRNAGASNRNEALAILQAADNSPEARNRLRRMLTSTESLAYARRAAENAAKSARAQLDLLEDSEAKATLASLPEFVVQRTY